MKRLLFITFLVFSCCQGTLFAKDWYEGMWEFDASLTQRYNPGISAEGIKRTKVGFDKWAGRVGVTPRRIKGRKAKLGVPYRVISKSHRSASFEVKGGVVELVKAFRPELRNRQLRCRITRLSNNVVAFEVPELRTIKMYMRRAG